MTNETVSYQEPPGWKQTRRSLIWRPVWPGWLPSDRISVKLISCRLYFTITSSLTWVKGSIIVTYSAFLMGFAKNVPPKVEDQESVISDRA